MICPASTIARHLTISDANRALILRDAYGAVFREGHDLMATAEPIPWSRLSVQRIGCHPQMEVVFNEEKMRAFCG